MQWIEARAAEWVSAGHNDNTAQQLTAMYLRTYISDIYVGVDWALVGGSVDSDFIAYAQGKSAGGSPIPATLRDPKTNILNDIQHFGASLGAVLDHDLPSTLDNVGLADFGGWGGDLITAAADCYNQGYVTRDAAYDHAHFAIGNNAAAESFGGSDMVSDVDAMVVGRAIRTTPATQIPAALSSRYASVTTATDKYEEFLNVRYQGADATVMMAALNLFDQDPLLDKTFFAVSTGLWRQHTGTILGDQYAEYPDLFSGVAQAYWDVFSNKFL